MKTTYQVLYWHDIPVQVRAKGRAGRASIPLPDRFQVAVDNAAMAAGLVGSDAYTEGYHWSEPQEHEGTPQEVAETVAKMLVAEYPKIDWRKTAASLGGSS